MSRAKTITTTTQETATDKVRHGLRAKGYSTLVRYETKPIPGLYSPAVAFTLYTDGLHMVVLQEFSDGKCEVYKPLVDSVSITKVIAAIP